MNCYANPSSSVKIFARVYANISKMLMCLESGLFGLRDNCLCQLGPHDALRRLPFTGVELRHALRISG
jgi:hypothetical protein